MTLRPAALVERDALIAAAIDCFRSTAFCLVGPAQVAERAGTTLEVLQTHFADRDAIVVAASSEWFARRMTPILPVAERAGAAAFLRAVVVANVADPALMRFLSALVNLAAFEDHPLSPHLQQQWLRFHALVQRTLAADVASGREPAGTDVARGAEQLVALYEGLQLQALVRPSFDLLGAFDRAVARLRERWSTPLAAPVWSV